ncbi:hypothetical protein ACNI5A_32090, partial [Klebsiella pneumoniae]|uniref:hypothetical protein n=1 Tax=Klebsiella pneumoniae TaxID=573 RepID=UPI003A8882D3
ILQSFGLFDPTNNLREFERAGKDWIIDRFAALRSVNARRIDGESFWQDVDTGAHLVFMVDGEKRICFFQLQEIQQCALNPLL